VAIVIEYLPLYVQGALVGLGLTVLAMIGALGIGIGVAVGGVSGNKGLRALCTFYTAIFRGVPPLVLLYIIYFGLPAWAMQTGNVPLIALLTPLDNRILSATIAFSLNSGAYTAEIIRASINSIHAEQFEAARSLGMSYLLSMRRIVLPQAMRVAIPPLGNEFIITLKGTSLASVLGVTELMRNAQMVAAATLQNLMAYSLAAVFYVVMVVALQFAVNRTEKFLQRGQPRHL
jgi:His/Glu/Gln/Arg/opine family amino acid ABC transporter permease subunit